MLPSPVKGERVSIAESQAIMGCVEALFYRSFRIKGADAFDEPLSFNGAGTAFGQDDALDFEVRRPGRPVIARQRHGNFSLSDEMQLFDLVHWECVSGQRQVRTCGLFVFGGSLPGWCVKRKDSGMRKRR